MTSLAAISQRRAVRWAALIGCVSAVVAVGYGTSAGAPMTSPTAMPGDRSAHLRLGLDDAGTTVHVHAGDRIVVRLPGGASGGYHRPRSSAPGSVSRTSARGGYPSETRAVAHFVAIAGHARLHSITDFTCLHTTPQCLPPQRVWSVKVRVRAGTAAGSGTSSAVGPDRSFVGVVNGSSDKPTINVVCPGPAGGTAARGAPASGQSVAVRVSPALSGPGFTGSTATRIVAVFNDDRSMTVTFRHYDHPKSIPTSLRLPCGGTGVVRFVPRPKNASRQIDRVRVTYANIAD